MTELPINQIIQGDALEVLKTLPEESIDCVVTSPPYNKGSANRKSNPKDSWAHANISYGEFTDDLPEQEYQDQQKELIKELLRILKKDGSIFYNHKYRIVNHQIISPEKWLGEFCIRQVIIWDRSGSPALDPIRFMPTYEQIYWITKEVKTPYFNPKSFVYKDIWRISPANGNEHPAPFPEDLAGRCILATCPEGGICLDPFMGSGTTALVAKKLGRNYVGIELNPAYIKIAQNRINSLPQKML